MRISFASQSNTAKRSFRRRKWAFSLPEVLFATGLTGFSVMSAFSGYSFGFGAVDSTRQELRATQVLQEKTETIRLYNWDQVKTPGFVPTTFTAWFDPSQTNGGLSFNGTVSITNQPVAEATYSTNVCQVTVSVSWTNGLATRQRSMSTLVSRYGIQNYVY